MRPIGIFFAEKGAPLLYPHKEKALFVENLISTKVFVICASLLQQSLVVQAVDELAVLFVYMSPTTIEMSATVALFSNDKKPTA